jgi:alanine racemase
MTRPVIASIDSTALQHNLNQVRQLAPEARVMAIVKANAYGHDLYISGRALQSADAIGLLELDDAIKLRNAGFTQAICLLEGFFDKDEIPLITEHQLEPVIHSHWQLDALEQYQQEDSLSVWLKIDTGMNRLGFTPVEFNKIKTRLSSIQCIKEISVMSHLANADSQDNSGTIKQLQCFNETTASVNLPRSLANSAAIIGYSDCQMDWVRPGIMLYGSSPFETFSAKDLNLQAVMTLQSNVISIKQCSKGDAIGYGSTWVCPEDMPVAVIACGYGDGYPRHAPAGTPIMVAGKKSQLIGRVSMDMITADLRGIENVEVGSEVELWGTNISVDVVAKLSSTIAYELLCGITARVRREELVNG